MSTFTNSLSIISEICEISLTLVLTLQQSNEIEGTPSFESSWLISTINLQWMNTLLFEQIFPKRRVSSLMIIF